MQGEWADADDPGVFGMFCLVGERRDRDDWMADVSDPTVRGFKLVIPLYNGPE